MTKTYSTEHNAIRGFRRNFAHLANLSNDIIRADFINTGAAGYTISLDAVADYEADLLGALKASTLEGIPALRRSTVRKGATARVRAFFAHEIEQGVSRKEAIAKAVAQGYAYCTARTQYQVVFQGA